MDISEYEPNGEKLGTWDAKVADSIKKEEWQRLLTAIKRARVMVGY